MSDILNANIRKLNDKAKGRYANGYNNDAAINRNVAAEAEVLEDEPAMHPGPYSKEMQSHNELEAKVNDTINKAASKH